MNGDGSRKLLLHSTEGSTIEGAVAAYKTNNSWPHLTVDCRQRRVVQHLPLDVAARSLRNLAGGEETNRDGTILVQVELVGFATNPATIGSSADLEWFGREVVWPVAVLTGVPLKTSVAWLAYPSSYGDSPVRLSAAGWDSYSGVLGHQHAPENLHGDPGALDVSRILAAAQPPPQSEDPVMQPLMLAFRTARRMFTGSVIVQMTSATQYRAHLASYAAKGIDLVEHVCDQAQWDAYAAASLRNVDLEDIELDLEEIRADLADEEPA